ncbi:hypothetical protein E2562_001203 [Oryza meyeriana var. granulata]|uniref:DUF834 domain-containing protein n=1 Tax=Oryza meyeriana var. granulata TaxID=110450 RepID=A0A6G1DBW1_9ORYZ|nr:hypothetical protein E2562_001203 [Oryza meyeriana var. granulata]
MGRGRVHDSRGDGGTAHGEAECTGNQRRRGQCAGIDVVSGGRGGDGGLGASLMEMAAAVRWGRNGLREVEGVGGSGERRRMRAQEGRALRWRQERRGRNEAARLGKWRGSATATARWRMVQDESAGREGARREIVGSLG